MARGADERRPESLEQTAATPPAEEPEELDLEFEEALTAALALDATERIERLGQLASALKNDLDSSH
ncbi:MAG: hypothetical protein Q4A03_00020 [Rothia sp. (in: high G+C Gram-positive bacteria)]|uniref:hypothetical protein n=1 Tax=Rothia sp. (in: high G+C Gram-positive bacteria) TaxID=1885016 RepID=UPI0026F615C7|nr:hypothetical protein [Rothia sp. (in: high G+C Gram-positive bacteria)]